ncbi:MAG: hypothetical protein QXF17_03415 [Ignisphaera sp.]
MESKKSDGYKRIPIRIEVYKKIEEKHKSMNIDSSISKWISDLLLMNIKRYDYLKIYAPYISYIGHHENEFFLRDKKDDRVIEIILKDKMLFCKYCNNNDCIHIHYVLILPEFGKFIECVNNKKEM